MKKLTTFFSTMLLSAAIFFAGCTTLNVTPAQGDVAAALVEQAANQGAAYAIHQNAANAQYFLLAETTLDTFVLGTDLSPAAFTAALNKVAPQTANQWVSLGISAATVAYDAAFSSYVTSAVNTNAIAKEFIVAAEDGFKLALGQTNLVPFAHNSVAKASLKVSHPGTTPPDLAKIRKDICATVQPGKTQ